MIKARAKPFDENVGLVGFDPGIDNWSSLDGGGLDPFERIAGIVTVWRYGYNPVFPGCDKLDDSFANIEVVGVVAGIEVGLGQGCDGAVAQLVYSRHAINIERKFTKGVLGIGGAQRIGKGILGNHASSVRDLQNNAAQPAVPNRIGGEAGIIIIKSVVDRILIDMGQNGDLGSRQGVRIDRHGYRILPDRHRSATQGKVSIWENGNKIPFVIRDVNSRTERNGRPLGHHWRMAAMDVEADAVRDQGPGNSKIGIVLLHQIAEPSADR